MSNVLEQTPGYRIKTVASITGLSTHVIRKWEERYHLLHPHRESNSYRVYTEEDIQLLLYVKAQLAQGESIGQLSQAGEQDLKRCMQKTTLNLSSIPLDYQHEAGQVIRSARRQDLDVIEHILGNWINNEGLETTLEQILFPLLRFIGELWHQGELSISGEHSVTRVVRQHLVTALRTGNQCGQAQALIACMPGEYHEVAPLTAAFLLKNRGWQVTYLGANVPFEVVQLALRRARPDLMILSCTTEPQPKLGQQWVQTIVQQFQPHCPVMVGGPGFSGYGDVWARYKVQHLKQMREVITLDPKKWAPN